jgi:hypothetical protein
MTIFKTKTGYVELIGQWRDGETPRARGGIARLTVRDDVKNAVYKFTGKRHDALEALIARYVGSSESVAVIDHSHIEIQRRNDAW